MKIIIKDKEFQYENKIELIDEIMDKAYEEVRNLGEIIESLNIDGEEVYINFGEYIFNNIQNIKEIKVKSITITKLIENTLVTTLDYIENSMDAIEPLSNRLQRGMGQAELKDISDLSEGIEWIMESFLYIDRDSNISSKVERKEEWNLYAKEVYTLGSIMPELLLALSDQNNKIASTILKDKIIPIFQNMVDRILELIRID